MRILHRHVFHRFELQELGRVYFVGYRCECGEPGYAIPVSDPPVRVGS